MRAALLVVALGLVSLHLPGTSGLPGGSDDEAGDGMEEARRIEVGQPVDGHVGDPDDLEDWYVLALPAQTRLEVAIAALRENPFGGDLPPFVQLRDPRGELVAAGIANEPATFETFIADAEGDWYLRVSQTGRWSYSFVVSASPETGVVKRGPGYLAMSLPPGGVATISAFVHGSAEEESACMGLRGSLVACGGMSLSPNPEPWVTGLRIETPSGTFAWQRIELGDGEVFAFLTGNGSIVIRAEAAPEETSVTEGGQEHVHTFRPSDLPEGLGAGVGGTSVGVDRAATLRVGGTLVAVATPPAAGDVHVVDPSGAATATSSTWWTASGEKGIWRFAWPVSTFVEQDSVILWAADIAFPTEDQAAPS